MSNKWARRYRRHQRTHVEYFTALAEQLAKRGEVTMPLGGDVMFARLHYVDSPRSHEGLWLETSDLTGRGMRASRVGDYGDRTQVEHLADSLMRRAALIPGVTLPRDTTPHELPETWRERRDRHDQEMLSMLEPGEDVRALGACADITDHGTPDSQKLERVLVTDRRIVWGPIGRPDLRGELRFDSVTSFVGMSSATHRYAIQLQHGQIQLRYVTVQPTVGDAEERLRTFDRTRLAFSRRDTNAAVSIRAELARRQRQDMA